MKFNCFLYSLTIICLFRYVVYSKSIPEMSSFEENSDEYADLDDDSFSSLENNGPPRKRSLNILEKKSIITNSVGSQKPCGIMYKNKEPVGILQPYEESFKLIPVHQQKLVLEMNDAKQNKRSIIGALYPRKFADDKDYDNPDNSENAEFVNENFPYYLTNFKIDNKVHEEKKEINKRDANETSGIVKREEQETVEEQLRDILDDMGLIDNDVNEGRLEKRDAEDEDLEKNSISMVKSHDDHMVKNYKREEITNKLPVESNVIEEHETLSSSFKVDKKREMPQLRPFRKNKRRDYKNNLAERRVNFLMDSIRFKSKRNAREAQESAKLNKNANNNREKREKENEKRYDKMIDDLTQSGDLTLSGNKSPLALPSSTIERSADSNSSELSEYEKGIESQIRSKIQALKEQVKREINALKEKEERNSDELIRKKRNLEAASEKSKFKTLLDEETKSIDPAFASMGDMKPYIRRRRDLNLEDSDSTSNNFTMRKPKYISDDIYEDIGEETKNTKRSQEAAFTEHPNNQRLSSSTKCDCSSGTCSCDQKAAFKNNCHCDTNGCTCDSSNNKFSNFKEYVDYSNGKDTSIKRKRAEEVYVEDGYDDTDYFKDDDKRNAHPLNSESEYYIDLHPAVFSVDNENNIARLFDSPNDKVAKLFDESSPRERRYDDASDLAELHASPQINSRISINSRNKKNSHSRVRRRVDKNLNKEQIQLIDMSDEDLFGALPQSFDGELGRYKRVKRDKRK